MRRNPAALSFCSGSLAAQIDLELLQGEWADLLLRSAPHLIEDAIPFDEYSSLHKSEKA